MNLLTNAVKYTERGTVTFTMKLDKKEGNTATLNVSVKDTGIGIKEEDRDALFESFERLDEIRNHNIEGTGLGLSIVTNLLSLMGSRLSVESVYGKGSCFSFILRQEVADDAPIGDYKKRLRESYEKGKEEELINVPGAKILVVDDNEMNLKVCVNLLKLMKIKPDTVSSGMEAIESMRKNVYDIVLLDHMMPKMDGIETLKKLQEEGLVPPETVVIALTANAVVGAREMYLEAGFDDYLSKPVDLRALERALKKYLPESRQQKEVQGTAKANPGEPPRKMPESWTKDKPESELRSKPGECQEDEILEFYPENEERGSEGNVAANRSFAEIRKELEELGIKVSDGLAYCGGEEEFYLELLGDYVRSAETKEKELGDAIAAKDLTNYAIKVHALKGVSKTIGEGKIFEAALALEMAAKEANTEAVEREHPKLMEKFVRDVAAIRRILQMD